MKADAALIDRIGEQFIPNNAIGISELIKNSYDADATRVLVDVGSAFDKDEKKRSITIRDNGHGMDKSDIEEKFMVIANESKKRNKLSPKGRYCTGEMGLGRFALQRLGMNVVVYTKKIDCNEWKLTIDWGKFQPGMNIQDVEHPLVDDHKDKKFEKNQSGTHIVIKNMKQGMEGNNLQKLHKAIGNLISPFVSSMDFSIEIQGLTGNRRKWEEFDIQRICEQAHYSIEGQLQEGKILWEYSCKNPWSEGNGKVEFGMWDVKDLVSKLPGNQQVNNLLTNIRFHAYGFVRDNKLLKKLKTSSGTFSKNQLDEHIGVRVYRDSHRVYPYGERLNDMQVNDWLSLDKSRMSASTKWFSNDQIIAAVAFKGQENPLLADTASRSGMQENTQYSELVTITRAFMMAWKTQLVNKDHVTKEPNLNLCILCNAHACICQGGTNITTPPSAPPLPPAVPAKPTSIPTPVSSPTPPPDDAVVDRIRGVIGNLENLGSSRGSISDKALSKKIKKLGQELVDLSDEIADQGD